MSYDLLYSEESRIDRRSIAIVLIGSMSGLLFLASSIVALTRDVTKPQTMAEQVAAARLEEAALVKANGGKPLTARQIVLRAMEKARTYRFTRTDRDESSGGLPTKSRGSVDLDKDLSLTRMKAGDSDRGTMLVHKEKMYVEATPEARSQLKIPAGKRWILYDSGKDGDAMMVKMQRAFAGLRETDLLKNFRFVKRSTLRGEAVKIYRVTLDFTEYLRATKKALGSRGNDFEEALAGMTARLEVSIDSRGYVVREKGIAVREANGKTHRQVSIEDRFDHDRAVGLSIPAPGEVFKLDFEKMFGGSTSEEFSESSDSFSGEQPGGSQGYVSEPRDEPGTFPTGDPP